jgi:hypothetical protein
MAGYPACDRSFAEFIQQRLCKIVGFWLYLQPMNRNTVPAINRNIASDRYFISGFSVFINMLLYV